MYRSVGAQKPTSLPLYDCLPAGAKRSPNSLGAEFLAIYGDWIDPRATRHSFQGLYRSFQVFFWRVKLIEHEM